MLPSSNFRLKALPAHSAGLYCTGVIPHHVLMTFTYDLSSLCILAASESMCSTKDGRRDGKDGRWSRQ